jgi:hypothetical protein
MVLSQGRPRPATTAFQNGPPEIIVGVLPVPYGPFYKWSTRSPRTYPNFDRSRPGIARDTLINRILRDLNSLHVGGAMKIKVRESSKDWMCVLVRS